MAILCKTFATTHAALQASEALSAAGVPLGDVGLLIGRAHARDEGTSARHASIEPAQPLGESARASGPDRRRAAGAPGPSNARRRGSFDADDRPRTIASRAGQQHVYATGDDDAQRLLSRAHVPDGVARRIVRHLHEGKAVVVVQLVRVDLGTAEALIGSGTTPA